jgi:EXLDI family protein
VSGGGRPAENTLDVYDTLEELREHVPEVLWAVVSAAVNQPQVEELDI